jgi:hypothetical protein
MKPKELINEINKANTSAEMVLVSERVNEVLMVANEAERLAIKEAVSSMSLRLHAQTDTMIAEGQKMLSIEGKSYNLADWVTIREYARRYGIAGTQVISNWIKRGIIPQENIIEIDELNNLRLIKAVAYSAR